MAKNLISLCVVVLLLVVSFTGCVARSEYEELLAEYVALVEKYGILEGDYQNLNEAHQQVQVEYKALEDRYGDLEVDFKKAISENDALKVALEKAVVRRFADIEELDKWMETLGGYSSESSDAVQWLDRALRIQRQALDDGYIVNVELYSDDDVYYTVWCSVTLTDGSYYYWDPDTKEIFYWLDIRHF